MTQNNPLEGIPEELKDVETYPKIIKEVMKAGYVDHKHKHVVVWNRCKRCQNALARRREVLDKWGFRDYEQFMAWRQVMDVIYNKREIRLPK